MLLPCRWSAPTGPISPGQQPGHRATAQPVPHDARVVVRPGEKGPSSLAGEQQRAARLCAGPRPGGRPRGPRQRCRRRAPGNVPCGPPRSRRRPPPRPSSRPHRECRARGSRRVLVGVLVHDHPSCSARAARAGAAPATRRRPPSRCSAGAPASSSSTLRSARVTVIGGPIGRHPWLTSVRCGSRRRRSARLPRARAPRRRGTAGSTRARRARSPARRPPGPCRCFRRKPATGWRGRRAGDDAVVVLRGREIDLGGAVRRPRGQPERAHPRSGQGRGPDRHRGAVCDATPVAEDPAAVAPIVVTAPAASITRRPALDGTGSSGDACGHEEAGRSGATPPRGSSACASATSLRPRGPVRSRDRRRSGRPGGPRQPVGMLGQASPWAQPTLAPLCTAHARGLP